MATSRGGTPANPTLVATTEDAARGGLFARSNLGNTSGSSPTTGTDTHVVSGVINGTDLILTLNNGDTVTITDLPQGGGGGTGPSFQPTDVVLNSNLLEITFADGSFHTQDLSSLQLPGTNVDNSGIAGVGISNTGSNDAPQLNLSLDELSASTNILSTDSIAFVSGGTSQVISFSDFRSALNIGGANLDENDFVDTTTVTVTDGTTAGTVEIDANMLDSGGNAWNTLEVSSSLVGPNMRPLQLSLTGTTLTLQETPAGPPGTPTPRGSVTPPPTGQTIFDTPAPVTTSVTISDGTIDTSGTGPTATVRDTTGTVVPQTPTVTMDTVTVTIPSSAIDAAGDYPIDISIPTLDDDGNAGPTINEMPTYTRIAPFFQSDADMTTSDEVKAATASSNEWNGTMTVGTNDGSTMWFAVLGSELASNIIYCSVQGNPILNPRVGFLRAVNVIDAAGTAMSYNIFRVNANVGQVLINFRTTRT